MITSNIQTVNSGKEAVIFPVNNLKSAIESNVQTDIYQNSVLYKSSKIDYTNNTELIQKLKNESDKNIDSFKELVKEMFLKQGITFETSDDIWKVLATGDFQVDAKTKAKATEDISEDGYWGVKQTSERIFSFAKALSGGIPEKMEDMLDAFKNGFELATEAWGEALPDISQQTYDAVLKKFEDYKTVNSEE